MAKKIYYETINTKQEKVSEKWNNIKSKTVGDGQYGTARWASKDEIMQLINEEKFIPYCPGFIELLFFNQNKRGLINE